MHPDTKVPDMVESRTFARLEDTSHGQCLAVREFRHADTAAEEGHIVTVRIPDWHGDEIKMVLGPFEDEALAQWHLDNLDLEHTAGDLADMIRAFFKPVTVRGDGYDA